MNKKAISEKIEQIESLLDDIWCEVKKEYFNLRPLGLVDGCRIFPKEKAIACGFADNFFMQVRSGGEYDGRALYLSSEYNWELTKDSMHKLVLIPTKKIVEEGQSIYFDLAPLMIKPDPRLFDYNIARQCGFENVAFMQVRYAGEYQNIAFWLNDEYSWELKRDSLGDLVLIPEYRLED